MLRIRILICLFIFIGNYLLSQVTLFEENFNNCSLNSGWSYVLNGNQNAIWKVGIPDNKKAMDSSIDGSCMLYFDDDLTGENSPKFDIKVFSPYFDGSDYSEINFTADVHFRRDKSEFFRIIIDNGIRRHIIREFKDKNFSGEKFSDYVNIKNDISFIATDSMRIIFEYDDNNEFAWWAGVDNIKITGKRGGNIVLGETFDDCKLPSGWSTEVVNGKDNWLFGIFDQGRSIDGTCFSSFNDDILGEFNALSKIRIKSPTFNGATFSSYILTYDLIYRTAEPSEYLQLYVDNGKEWIPIKTYNGDFGGPNVDQSEKDTIDLSAFRNDSISLIWEYNDGGWAWWVGFDNIKVVASGDINDKCSKATPLNVTQDCITFDNTNSLNIDEFNDLSLLNNSGILYFKWKAESSESYVLSTQSNFNDHIQIFSGTCENKTTIKSINKDEYGFEGENIYFDATIGQEYIFRITGIQSEFGLDKGRGCINLKRKNETIVNPDRELCQNALPLVVGQPCLYTFNINAKLEGPKPKTNIRSRADVWYSFSPSTDGDFIFDSGAEFADVIAVYEGECNALKELMSDFNGQNIAMNNLLSSKTYYIQVSGYFALMEGNLCSKIKQKPIHSPPSNPICNKAIDVTLNTGCNSFNNNAAGFSGIKPQCDVYLNDDIWLAFIAPDSKSVYIKLKSDFESLISLYTGSCNNLKSIYCDKKVNHCNGYIHIFDLIIGEKYYIQVGSEVINGRSNSGNVCIEILETEPLWQKLEISATQECVSKGAIKFIPQVIGGVGQYTLDGLGILEPVAGNDEYYLQATDAEGCVASTKIKATSCNEFGCSLVSQIETKNTSCFNANDGSIKIINNGGLLPYTYKWSTGQTSNEIMSLAAGIYNVTVSDLSGCEKEENVTIEQPSKILANPTLTQPNCFNENTGMISLFTIGGAGSYNYVWSNGQTSSTIQNLSASSYTLTISDSKGCFSVETLELTQPNEISISSTSKNPLCFDDKSGEILTELKNDNGIISYLWSNGATTSSIRNLGAGTYSVSVSDANNCLVSRVYNLSQPESIKMKIDSISLMYDLQKNSVLNLSFSGGTLPYTYQWYRNDTKYLSNIEDINPSIDGLYYVEVIDANGCKFVSPIWEVSQVSSIVQNENSKIKLYPNPTSHNLYLSLGDESIIAYELLDNRGRLLKESKIISSKNNLFIDVSIFPSSIYVIKVKSNKNEYYLPFLKIN